MSACPLCGDRDERDKAHCALCSGTGCVGEAQEWSDAEKLTLAMQRVEQLQNEKCALAAAALNARECVKELLHSLRNPKFMAHAEKQAKQLIATELLDA